MTSYLPYFKKSERNRIHGLLQRGKNGPLPVSFPTYLSDISDNIIQAGVQMGWRNEDCQEYEEDECIQFVHNNVFQGRIWSSSTAYLEPVSEKRENLHIMTDARVTKLLINKDGSVQGVKFLHEGKLFSKTSRKEVILSAGAIDSPKLLMLSGIGPKNHLSSLGIKLVKDLPVGNNLQSHYGAVSMYQVSKGTITVQDLEKGQDEYLKNKTGPMTTIGYEVLAVNRVEPGRLPTVQHVFYTISGDSSHHVGASSYIMRPESFGTVRLASSDFKDAPLIDPKFFSAREDLDFVVKGMIDLHKLFQTRPLRNHNPQLIYDPACTKRNSFSRYVKCAIKNYNVVAYTPVGTVKMGPLKQGGVVNNKLQVYDIKNLRVIDASIAPYIPSLDVNSMAVMVGEKGADLIKEGHEILIE